MYRYEKIAKEHFGTVINQNKKDEFIFKCIKCGRPKLYVNTKNGLYHCFRCDFKGRLKTKVTMADIKEKYNMDNLIKQSKSTNKELNLVPFFGKSLTEEQEIALKNRGLTESDIRFYNICGRGQDNRIQIPNFVKGCFTDIVCAWQYDKSKVNDKNPKYLNTEGTLKSETLFNVYNLDKGITKVFLCEGIFNAITAGRDAIASYGCSLSDRQCELILEKEPKTIVIAYDSDEPGVKGSLKVIKKLKESHYKGIVEYVLLPNGVDVNDLGRDNFLNYYNNNKVVIDLNNPVSIKLPKLLYESRKNTD